MYKTVLLIALSFVAGTIIFWPQIKKYVWLKICRRILNYFMGGESR
jgi:hypothetical protein